jgi:DNA-directed RNA polymerase specialized sigma24 family protein
MQLQNFIEPEGEFEHKPPDKHRIKKKEEEGVSPESGDDEPRVYASAGDVTYALEEAFRKDGKLLIRLQGQTLKWIRMYFHSNLMGDLTAEDVVYEVIQKIIISQKRKWNPEKIPYIINFLLMVILSFVRNEWKKQKKNKIVSIDIYDKDGDLTETNIIDLQRAYLREDLNIPQFRVELEDQLKKLFKELENDVNAYFVLEALLDTDHSTVKRPEVIIAQQLQLSEPEVKNAIRRIRRRVSKLIIQI